MDVKKLDLLYSIASIKETPDDNDCDLVLERPDLLSLAILSEKNTHKINKFFLSLVERIIINHSSKLKHEHFIHSALSIIKFDFRTDSVIFSYIITQYMLNDTCYDEYIRMKKHNVDHYNIITGSKRVQKCLEIVYNICKNRIDSDVYFEILQNVCKFNGSLDNKNLMNDCFESIKYELLRLEKYDFLVIVGKNFCRIYSFIIHEILDCGDDLKDYILELAQFLFDSGLKNYIDDLENYEIDNKTWIHEQFIALKSSSNKV